MKNFLAYCAIIIHLTGCAFNSESYISGSEFSQSTIDSIIRDKTTTSDLVALLGQPQIRYVVPGSGEKWIYNYETTSTSSHRIASLNNTSTTSTKKTLTIIIKNGTVNDFKYIEN